MVNENYLKLQRAYFRLLGFDIIATGQNWPRPYMAFCTMMPLISFIPFMGAFVIQNIKNVDSLTDSLCNLLVALLSIYKFGMIIYIRTDNKQLLAKFRDLLSSAGGDRSNDIINRENQRDQFISGLYKNIFVIAFISANVMPLLRMLSSYWKTGHAEPDLPYPSIYPWNNHYIPNYLFSYAWNVFASWGVVAAAVSLDTLFYSYAHNLCALFKIAQYNIEHFKDHDQNQNESQEKLVQVFRLYKTSLDLSRELSSCYQPLVFAQIFVSSMQLCVLGYQLSDSFNQPEVVYYASFLSSMLVQVYIYCYCGEYIKTESANFAFAIYNSPWYETPTPAIARSLVISMARAQHPSSIQGYFFEANLETFATIVNTSISYITLLRSFASMSNN